MVDSWGVIDSWGSNNSGTISSVWRSENDWLGSSSSDQCEEDLQEIITIIDPNTFSLIIHFCVQFHCIIL